MGIEVTHPEYDAMSEEWCSIRDAHRGSKWVKSLYDKYLPPTSGMYPTWNPAKKGNCLGGMKDAQLSKYLCYVNRAEFPDSMTTMCDTAMGLLWNKDATIELPKRMQYLIDNATAAGESIQEFMMRVTAEQLLVQRCGVMIDMPAGKRKGPPNPYLCLYNAESIINWDAGSRTQKAYAMLNLVVLNESSDRKIAKADDPFGHEWVESYRVLSLGPVATYEDEGAYKYGVFTKSGFQESLMQVPTIYGKALPFIPFYFINGTNCLPCVERPRASALAEKCFSSYRTSADYEQQGHEQSQETLVLEGGDEKKTYAIGSGAVLTPGAGQKAYFIGLMGAGMPEMAKMFQNKQVELMQMSGQLVDVRSLQRESGEALSTRVAGQTATLATLAKTLGAGMTRCLRDLALLLGEDPKAVRIKPNTNFISPELFAKTLVELITAKNAGYPITTEDLHRLAQERGISTKDFKAMMKILNKEPKSIVVPGTILSNPAGTKPDVIEGASTVAAAKAKGQPNPTGLSPRGKTRTTSKKNK